MNDFLMKLANSSAPARSSEHLQLLGRRAAKLYAGGEAPNLTDAVRDVVSKEEELTREQVSRISELANQEAWKVLFAENGERQVQFEPADAASVIGELAERPKEVDVRNLEHLDFLADVPNQEIPADLDLAEMFGLKKDSPEYEALNPTVEEQAVVEKTASMKDFARYGIDNAASLLADAGEEFYQLVKKAHLDEGAGILQISKAVGVAINDPEFARDCMQKAAERLSREGVAFNRRDELEKVAHALVVNSEHPLIQAAANLETVAFSYYSAEAAHTKLASAHRVANKNLQAKAKAHR